MVQYRSAEGRRKDPGDGDSRQGPRCLDQGLAQKASSVRVLELPTWCVEMLVRRPRTNLLVFQHPRVDQFEIRRTQSRLSTEPLATRSSRTVTARPSPRLWTTLACRPGRQVINSATAVHRRPKTPTSDASDSLLALRAL